MVSTSATFFLFSLTLDLKILKTYKKQFKKISISVQQHVAENTSWPKNFLQGIIIETNLLSSLLGFFLLKYRQTYVSIYLAQ